MKKMLIFAAVLFAIAATITITTSHRAEPKKAESAVVLHTTVSPTSVKPAALPPSEPPRRSISGRTARTWERVTPAIRPLPIATTITASSAILTNVQKFVIPLRAQNAVNIHGISIDIFFDPGQFTFDRMQAGRFLTEGAGQLMGLLPMTREIEPGHIVASLMRFSSDIGVSGSGEVCSFEFTPKAGVTNGTFRFGNYSIAISDGVPPDPELRDMSMPPIVVTVSP